MADVEAEAVGAQYVVAVLKQGAFAVQVGDELVPIVAMNPRLLAAAEKASGIPWTQMVESPTADLTAAQMLINAAEEQAGEDLSEAASVAELMGRFVKLPSRNGSGGDG